mgnify:CR=1 FL=1
MEKVLHTLRVLEIGGLGPGPFCAMHLADLGADVISLVRPGNGGLPITGDLLNRGKRSISLDLSKPIKLQAHTDDPEKLVESIGKYIVK